MLCEEQGNHIVHSTANSATCSDFILCRIFIRLDDVEYFGETHYACYIWYPIVLSNNNAISFSVYDW